MRKIKTAILGYGRSGSTLHADPIERLEQFEMKAVCDIDQKALEKAKARFDLTAYTDYHKMIAEEPLDLIVIVTRSDQHKQMVIDCLKAGHNVLITKPWCRNADEAREMIAVAKETGKKLLPWLPARWGSDFLKLKDLIDSGVIGRVFQIRRRESGFSTRFDWQTETKYAGGMVLNWGAHLIEPPMFLAGGTVSHVYGNIKQILTPGDAEDNFIGILKMDNGTTVISEMATMSLPDDYNWIIQGDKGTITVQETKVAIRKMTRQMNQDETSYANKYSLEVVDDTADGPHRITNGNRYGDAKVIYPEIGKAILGEEDYAVSLESALMLTKILDAIKTSSATGQTVYLDKE